MYDGIVMTFKVMVLGEVDALLRVEAAGVRKVHTVTQSDNVRP